MHMADALVSAPVAITSAVAAASLIAVASNKVKHSQRDDIIPLMGMMGAFVFAAQMINFAIPGTGSSGHIIGGVLLAAILGPWAAFLALSSVIIIQCLIFADGGLMALGCNIINMAAVSTLISYPLVYRPIARKSLSPFRLMTAAIAASVIALQLGALGVSLQTELSGITALPASLFIGFMLPIHLAIGAVEGLATGAVLVFLAKYRPDTLFAYSDISKPKGKTKLMSVIGIFAAVTLFLSLGFSWLASDLPDGLEWSVEKTSGINDLVSIDIPTAVMPDYNASFAGIVGALIVMTLLWAFSSLLIGKLAKSKRQIRG